MSEDRPDRRRRSGQTEDPPPYRVYRAGAESPKSDPRGRASSPPDDPAQPGERRRPDRGERPYTVYRSAPRGLMQRLRGEDGPAERVSQGSGGGRGGGGGRRGGGGRDEWAAADGAQPRKVRWWRKRWTPFRVLRWVVGLIVCWLLLSAVLFFVSAQTRSGNLPAGAKSQLAGGSTMLFSPETVVILGLDNRPTSGAGSKEGGLTASQTSEKSANTDTIMLWRIGGGVSRRLSIPRDTLVNIPGCGEQKINAAWSCGGPALTLKVIKQFTGISTINHLIVIDLANFPKFINDIGGVNVRTGRICSNISGGAANGGFTLNLKPGVHHLNGEQALVLARTRENSCNAAYDDLNREAAQQQILDSIKSQLFTVHTFLHLPWAAWDAPGVIQTDMGGSTLMQLFISSEIGGSAPADVLKPTGSETLSDGEDALVSTPADVRAHVRKLMTGK
jgi:LCP family protein required for cell wall assembly